MTRLNQKYYHALLASAAAVLALAFNPQPAPAEDGLRLPGPETTPSGTAREATITQIGEDNSAVVSQASVPSGEDARQALDLEGQLVEFDYYDSSGLPVEADLAEDAEPNTQNLSTLLETFGNRVDTFGGNNAASVVQFGGQNSALAVQAGSDNRMRTVQRGSENIGVHLQRGSGNNTVLAQYGSGNVNALVAQGGVTGTRGTPVRLNVAGGVKGFSLRAQGRQNYSTVNVKPNGMGGLNIDVRR